MLAVLAWTVINWLREHTLIRASSTSMLSAKVRFVCVVGFGFLVNSLSSTSTSSFPSRAFVSVILGGLGIMDAVWC